MITFLSDGIKAPKDTVTEATNCAAAIMSAAAAAAAVNDNDEIINTDNVTTLSQSRHNVNTLSIFRVVLTTAAAAAHVVGNVLIMTAALVEVK